MSAATEQKILVQVPENAKSVRTKVIEINGVKSVEIVYEIEVSETIKLTKINTDEMMLL